MDGDIEAVPIAQGSPQALAPVCDLLTEAGVRAGMRRPPPGQGSG